MSYQLDYMKEYERMKIKPQRKLKPEVTFQNTEPDSALTILALFSKSHEHCSLY